MNTNYIFVVIFIVWFTLGCLLVLKPDIAVKLLGAKAFADAIDPSPEKRTFRLRIIGVLMLVGWMVAVYFELSRDR